MMPKIVVFVMLTFFSSKSSRTVSSYDLDLGGTVCQDMWDAAGSNLKVPSELKVDTVGKNPLFTLEPAGQAKIASSKVFKAFEDLLNANTGPNQNTFISEIISNINTNGPVGKALDYLNTQAILSPAQTPVAFQNTLKEMWFKPPGKQGFGHVFIGDLKPGFYSGFHNWYQFYLQQRPPSAITNVNVGIMGLTYNTEPSIIDLKFDWQTKTKPSASTLFVGTSPAFDFALFSVCFITLYKGGKGGNECTCKIHKSKLTLKAIQKPALLGRVCTAYPTKVEAAAVCTSFSYNDRTDCGWLGIDHYACAKRGCCFDSKLYGGHAYWCFYPADHKCHGILPKDRSDCGFLGISRKQCEDNKCCFDENFGGGVNHCFHGKP